MALTDVSFLLTTISESTRIFLILRMVNGPEKIYRRDSDYLFPIAQHNIRHPEGLHEGHIETFANIYFNVANTLLAKEVGKDPKKFNLDFPTVVDGARGVYFINSAVKSSKVEKWIDIGFDPSWY